MKVVFVVDSVEEIKSKISTISSHFGEDIRFVVKAPFDPLFETYGLKPNAIYTTNLAKTIHVLLFKSNLDDVIVYYSSLKLTDSLLNKFKSKIRGHNKVVSIKPNYNAFEKFSNSIYNGFVKFLFKSKDSLVSPKLQFLPAPFVEELLSSHFGNKLFEINPQLSTTFSVEDKEINKSLKIHSSPTKTALISIAVALIITALLIMSLAFFKVNYLLIVLFVCLYVLDVVICTILQCKQHFDARFLK